MGTLGTGVVVDTQVPRAVKAVSLAEMTVAPKVAEVLVIAVDVELFSVGVPALMVKVMANVLDVPLLASLTCTTPLVVSLAVGEPESVPPPVMDTPAGNPNMSEPAAVPLSILQVRPPAMLLVAVQV